MLALKRQPTISIKTVGPFDLGRLARLHQSCFDDAWSRADLAHLLALPGGFGILARLFEGSLSGIDGMRGVGFALCRVIRDEGELLSIGVGPSYRRRQIGAVLLRDCIERCQQVGATSVFLEVAADNHSAQSLYRSFGFVEVGKREGYYQRADGSRMCAYTMRSDLETIKLPEPTLQTCP